MMRFIAAVIFLASFAGNACATSCRFRSIESSYHGSSMILYAKFSGYNYRSQVYSAKGRPLIFAQFEVVEILKGDTSILRRSREIFGMKKTTISLNIGGWLNPWTDLDSNSYYLLYLLQGVPLMALDPDPCGRTRKIEDQDFTVSSRYDPDFGKDERLELIRLNGIYGPKNKAQTLYYDQSEEITSGLKTALNRADEKYFDLNKKYVILRNSFIAGTGILTAALFLLYFKMRRKNSHNTL